MRNFELILDDLDLPLVSVLVYNYNYGRYLEECLESIFAQTYPNIEVLFSDNASTDESWEIANALSKKYPGRMTITRNLANLGGSVNFTNCYQGMRGTYYVPLCSDDVMLPDYVERCLQAFKAGPQIGFVMVHNATLDGNGNRTDAPPFYNQSCIIKGEDQAAVYMMATVNPSISQIMYHKQKSESAQSAAGAFSRRWYGARIQDFNICTKYSMAYIKDPLLLYRIHGANDSLTAADNILEVIGPYLLQHQFADIASTLNMKKVVERLPASIEKLSLLALRYSLRFLKHNDETLAKRYFYLAPAMNPEIESHELFKKLQAYWGADRTERAKIIQLLSQNNELTTRTVSYDPPSGSIAL